MAKIELPSTPEDINHAVATEVLECFLNNDKTEWLVIVSGLAYKSFPVDAYTPATDLNQAFEGLLEWAKRSKQRKFELQGCRTRVRWTLLDAGDVAGLSEIWRGHLYENPEATALCLALIAAKRGEE